MRMRLRTLVLVATATTVVGCSGTAEPAPAPATSALPGPEFRSAAASACTEIINHRWYALESYQDDVDLGVEALLLSMGEESDHSAAEIADAMERVAAEVRRGAGELATVRASDPADQELWDRVLRSQADRAAALDVRVAALRAEDFDAIVPGATDVRDGEALEGLDLERRDCGLI